MLASILVGAISTPTLGVYDAASVTGTPVVVLGPNPPIGFYTLGLSINTGIVLQIAPGATPSVTVLYK
jgi:hypothetical protein